MIELPEALARAEEIRLHVAGKTVSSVRPPSKAHKFCWYNGYPEDYHSVLEQRRITGAEGFGIFVEILFEGGARLSVNDGVNIRLTPVEKAPKNYQLLIELTDRTALVFTVAMYGGIYLHEESYDDEYYIKSRQAVSPLAQEFESVFDRLRTESKGSLSAKAFLATNQRFPGIGNGVLQDILFFAGIHPKRKLETLTQKEWRELSHCTASVLRDMAEKGGRDTEKNLFGIPGGYQTKMSKNSLRTGCPICGGPVKKETYLGGSIYFCPNCQPEA